MTRRFDDLESSGAIRVRSGVPAGTLTTFRLGGAIESLLQAETIPGLVELLARLADEPFRILGGGSNVVVPDAGVREPVVQLGRAFFRFAYTDAGAVGPDDLTALGDAGEPPNASASNSVAVIAFGGAPLMSLSRKLTALGLSGLEFAAGIPASLGGAVAMNAGAHGSSMAEITERVFLASAAGLHVYCRSDLPFSYRSSGIAHNHVVAAAELRLVRRSPVECGERRASCLEYRRRTQPLHLPSAGSVFRNPTGAPAAGALLESMGLKGAERFGVRWSELHANWLVKVGEDARAAGVEELVALARARVLEDAGVTLEPEIRLWR